MTNRLAVMDHFRRNEVRGLTDWFRDALSSLLRWRRGTGGGQYRALTVLSPPAKALLRRYLEQDTKSLRVPTLAGAAMGLELSDVISISREPEPSVSGDGFVLFINPWAWEHLRRNPQLLAE